MVVVYVWAPGLVVAFGGVPQKPCNRLKEATQSLALGLPPASQVILRTAHGWCLEARVAQASDGKENA